MKCLKPRLQIWTVLVFELALAFTPLTRQRLHSSQTGFLQEASSRPLTKCHQTPLDGEVRDLGLNELQTLLRDAAEREDFLEAGQMSDELLRRLYGDLPAEEKKIRRKNMSWKGLGAAPWLVDRLDALNYTFPTTIQINAMESVNKILNMTGESEESQSIEEIMGRSGNDMGIVVSGSTGSGKTLSFLVPLLSTLSDSLFSRQRLRVGAEEEVGDSTGDLLERISIVTSPVIRSTSRKPVKGGGAIATGAALATLGSSGSDVKSPLSVIVVPTKELGIQTAILLYELIGGSIKEKATDIRGKANMFKYKGPKGVRVGCVLSDDEAEMGLKLQTDVAITMPKYLGKIISDGDLVPSQLRFIAYDEADLTLEQTGATELTALFDSDPDEREYSRLTFMVGASVTESLGNLAVRSRIIPEGKSYIASATQNAPLMADRDLDAQAEQPSELVKGQPKTASLKNLSICLDPGLQHRRAKVGNENGLRVLTRLLRQELKSLDELRQQSENDVLPPRVVIFFPDETTAKESIEPLRDALWGDHKLCVMLPETGFNPILIMEQFKNSETSVMLATPNAIRGLDFPAVTHVYTLYLPMDDPREYVHLAGRVGRVGQMGSMRGRGGQVISVLRDEEVDNMEVLASELGFTFDDIEIEAEEPLARTEDGELDFENADVNRMRQFLEDSMSFSTLEEDPEEKSEKANVVDVSSSVEDNDDEEEEEDDDDDESDEDTPDAFQ